MAAQHDSCKRLGQATSNGSDYTAIILCAWQGRPGQATGTFVATVGSVSLATARWSTRACLKNLPRSAAIATKRRACLAKPLTRRRTCSLGHRREGRMSIVANGSRRGLMPLPTPQQPRRSIRSIENPHLDAVIRAAAHQDGLPVSDTQQRKQGSKGSHSLSHPLLRAARA